MTRADVLQGVCYVLREKVGIEAPLEPTTDLVGDLQLDSVRQLCMVVELENHFKICFAPGAEQHVTTLNDVVSLIERCKSPKDDTL